MCGYWKSFTYLLIILSTSFANACSSQDAGSAMAACNNVPPSSQGDVVTDDEFILSLVEGPLAWESVKSILVDIEKDRVSSPHSPETTNYVVTSRKGESFYSYYLSEGNSFPLCLDINSPEVISRVAVFGKKFDFFSRRLDKAGDSVLTIDSLEGGNIVQLVFSEGRLVSVTYRTDYID
jgi:hypothetical protein